MSEFQYFNSNVLSKDQYAPEVTVSLSILQNTQMPINSLHKHALGILNQGG